MRLFIPKLGTNLTLTADWTFPLHHERRNAALFKAFDLPMWTWSFGQEKPPAPVQVTIPAGTVLTVDRIYIRSGAADFSSLTFRATFPGKKTAKSFFGRTGVRFWAKLADVNRIEFETP